MKTDERTNYNHPQGVQHDNETPLPKKPSVLFIVTTVSIILGFVTAIAMAYNGITH